MNKVYAIDTEKYFITKHHEGILIMLPIDTVLLKFTKALGEHEYGGKESLLTPFIKDVYFKAVCNCDSTFYFKDPDFKISAIIGMFEEIISITDNR